MSKTRSPARRAPSRTMAECAAPAAECTTAVGSGCIGGVVIRVGDDGAVRVRVGLSSEFDARRAVSCLLAPAVGDTVACLRTGPSELWMLAVLQRDVAAPAVLECEGDVHWRLPHGAMRLESARLELDAEQLALRGRRTHVVADEVEVATGRFRVCASSIKFIGSVLSTVMDRVNHFSRHYLRTTQGTDRVQATHIDHEAQQLVQLKGEHVLVNGGKLVKTRGAQIHFG